MEPTATLKITDKIKAEIAELSPAVFAFTMATGIVSVAAQMSGYSTFARVLFHFNLVAFGVLTVLYLLRLIFYFPEFRNDFVRTSVSPGFLTIVAGINIVGYQFVLFQNNDTVATVLFVLACILWCVLIYSLFTIIIIKREKDPLNRGINGNWLLIVVATESICVLGTALADFVPLSEKLIWFVSLSVFIVGCMLYIILITLIFYRLAFFRVRSSDLAPAYWINMGAVAIITLAGSGLVAQSDRWEFLHSIEGFLKGFTLLFWATGSWWIPLLVTLGIWRFVFQRTRIVYKSSVWGMVFPLGMYTVCTYKLADSIGVELLYFIPLVFVYIAIFAWSVSVLGMFSYGIKLFKNKPSTSQSPVR